jgi:hypothetical protein
MPAVTSRKTSTRKPAEVDQGVITAGKIFPDGILDLVASPNPCQPNLMFYDGRKTKTARRIFHDGTWYCAPELDSTIANVITLPQDLAPSGSLVELFADAAELVQGWLALPPEIAQQIALFEATTWLSDVLHNPPAAMLLGHRMAQAVRLFQLMGYGCRRALTLTGLNRASLLALPMDLKPTLLIGQPGLSRNLSQLLSAANHRGMRVPGRQGTVLDWVGSRAIFLGSMSGPCSWSGEALWISLPPVGPGASLPDERLVGKAQTLQDRFSRFRMDWLLKAGETGYSENDAPLELQHSELAQTLYTCVRYEPALIKTTTSLLHGLVEDARSSRSLDPQVVVLEVLWQPGHELREIRVARIAQSLSKLLYKRGGRYQYSEEETGWILKQLGFERVRGAEGKLVRFSDENQQLLHRLVSLAWLDLPKDPSCPLCTAPRENEPE